MQVPQLVMAAGDDGETRMMRRTVVLAALALAVVAAVGVLVLVVFAFFVAEI